MAALCACAGFDGFSRPEAVPRAPEPPKAAACEPAGRPAVLRSAEQGRVAQLEREVAMLHEDLRQAEDSMVSIESGLRSTHSRADAVSSIAEARIEVDRASVVLWRPSELEEARDKLAEAERQLEKANAGTAIFFAWRAGRIARTLSEEAEAVAANRATRFVRSRRVNLRAGPSTNHEVVEVLVRDTPVFLELEEGAWALVRTLGGPAGWVHGTLLVRR